GRNHERSGRQEKSHNRFLPLCSRERATGNHKFTRGATPLTDLSQNDVSTPTKIQRDMVEKSEPVRDIVAGTKKMRKEREKYLPKNPAESNDAYESRLKQTFLFNATEKTVLDMTGKVFVKPVVLKEDVAPVLKTWAENIDNAGRHL